MKNLIKIWSLLFGIVFLESCEKQIDPLSFVPDGELRYPAKANNAVYLAGENRLKLQFKLGPDPNVSKAIIYWNLKRDSLLIDINRASLTDNMVSVLIDNLPENVYNFEVYTFDKFGNKSVPTYITGRTYGSRFATILSDRGLNRYEAANESGDVKLIWKDSVLLSSKVQISYTDKQNVTRLLVVPNTENSTLLSNVNIAKEVKVTTMFAPEPKAIDTFKTNFILNIDPANLILQIAKPYNYIKLTGDADVSNWSYWWNNEAMSTWQGYGSIGYRGANTTGDAASESIWVTLDLGKPRKLKRMRMDYYYYKDGTAPKVIDLMAYVGSGVPSNLTIGHPDYWKDWVLIKTYDNSDPVEYPFVAGNATVNQPGFAKGLDASFELSKVPLSRYYRLRCRSSWTPWAPNNRNFSLSEITFWQFVQ